MNKKQFTFMNILILILMPITSYAFLFSKDGIWKNEKLQFYIQIKGEVFNRYQFTSLSCFKGGAGFLPSTGHISKTKLSNYFPYFINNGHLEINRPQENLSINLKRIKKLPYACRGQPVDTVLSNFYIFWQSINELYNFSHLEKKAWAEVFKKQLPSLIDLDMRLFESRAEEDIFLITKLEEILYQIADPHLFLIAPSVHKTIFADSFKNRFHDIYNSKNLQFTWLKKQIENIKGDIKWFANNNILTFKYENIIYINVIKLSDFGDSSQFDKSAKQNLKSLTEYILPRLTSDSKVVVDLRFNDGGSVEAANTISSLFSNKKEEVTFIQIGKETTIKPLSYNNGKGKKPLCLSILTSKFTASAAEYLTLNLIKVGGITIGEQTRGAFSPVVLKSLPNNWILGIPPFRTFDEFEKPLPENKGISPQVSKEWFFNSQQNEAFNLSKYTNHCS